MGVVLAPPAAPPRVGLIATARVLQGAEAGDRWEAGFSYLPESCAAGGVAPRRCSPTEITKTINDGDTPDNVEFDPVVLWAGDKCSNLDRPRDWEGRARRLLVACQSKLLAAEFWKGTRAKAMTESPNRYLASNDANTVTDGPVSEANALACLEEALADCSCGRGMIHATPGTMTHWKNNGMIERVPATTGFVYVTAMDTLVVGDAGYDGSDPNGNPAEDGSVWAYGTDLVDVRLGEVQTFGEVDRSINDFAYRAERLAAATWSGCCHIAAEIDINVCEDLAGS